MTYIEAENYLNTFTNFEFKKVFKYKISFNLERVNYLLERIGNPHRQLKCIHVAGTKGKGSTCAFTAHILKASGFKVGLYTSPHLCSRRERIRILDSKNTTAHDGFEGKISKEDFTKCLNKIKPMIEEVKTHKEFRDLTFFEVFTALALYYFAKKEVDFAVLEVGLGGRLDATNVVDAIASAIMPVSFDHTQQLGKTLRLIAKEKAAIVKNKNQHVIIAPQEKEAEDIIRKQIKKVGAKAFFVPHDLSFRPRAHNLQKQIFDVNIFKDSHLKLTAKLLGEHQLMNATVAIGLCTLLKKHGFLISSQAIRRGISETEWPGRFEIIQEDPKIIFDGAHNVASIQALIRTIQVYFPQKEITVIFGTSSDKNISKMIFELNKISCRCIFTKANHPRAFEFPNFVSVPAALRLALAKSTRNDVILVTGSLFVVADARQYLQAQSSSYA